MSGTALQRRAVLAAALWMGAAAGVHAQPAAYKCVSRGTVTYSQVPCPGARPVTDGVQRATPRSKEPPQDRARIARRALLSPEDRQECSALEAAMREQEVMLKAKGDTATLQDEMPLVQKKKRFRELRC